MECGVDLQERSAHLVHHGRQASEVVEIRGISRRTSMGHRRSDPADEEAHPEKEPDHVAEAAAQHGQSLKQHRNRRNKRHRGQSVEKQRREQGPQMERPVFGADQLHAQRRDCHHQHHGGEHGRIPQRFGHGVEGFAHRRCCEDLADACCLIAEDRSLHDVEADEGEERAGDESHQSADPGRVVDAAVVVELHHDVSCEGLVAEEDGESERDEEAGAANAGEEIGLHEVPEGLVPENGAAFHAAVPVR